MITYRSGTRQSLGFAKYCKVIPGETVATQHRPLILEMELEKPKRTKNRSRGKIELVTGCTVRRCEQFETSPATIEQELRPAV